MNKYLEFEFNYDEIEFIAKNSNLSIDEILVDSIRKVRNATIKNRVKDVFIGIDAGPNETLDRIFGPDLVDRGNYFKRLGFNFINFNIARLLASKYFNTPQRQANSPLSKMQYDVYLDVIEKLKNKLDFSIHMPTDDFIYDDPSDKLWESCLHLANEMGKIAPQDRIPLAYHSYRQMKSGNLANDLESSKNKTARLIIQTAKYLKHLETKGELKITLALEMLNQELPTSHHVRYCTSPYQVLETYHLAIDMDPTGLVQKYFDDGTFSVTFDVGHFLLDQKFQQLLKNKALYKTNDPLYFGFEEFSRKISLYHISGVLDKNYLARYLDNRRSGEFYNKFGKEFTHHCPFLISDVNKVGEVIKQVEVFSTFDREFLSDLP